MNTPAAPRPLPSHLWATSFAIAFGLVGVGLMASSRGKAGLLVAGGAVLLAGGLLVWLAIVRRSARGNWDEQTARLGLRPAELEPAMREGLVSRHPILGAGAGRGIERILSGRIRDREVFLIQAYREIAPGPFLSLLSFLASLLAAAATFAGEAVGDPRAGDQKKRTTVLLLPHGTNDAPAVQKIGAWTLSRSSTSTAIYVADRDIEPSNLPAFLDAAMLVFEARVAS